MQHKLSGAKTPKDDSLYESIGGTAELPGQISIPRPKIS